MSSPWTYADLDRRQRESRERVLAGERGRILLSEVAPVVTLGLRDVSEDLLLSEDALRERGIALLRTSRGGRATYHGPGQWLAFPVESLERLSGDRKGVRLTTERLLDAALAVCRRRFPRAEVRAGKEAGVWSEPGGQGGKVVAMGLRFEGGVLQHGLSLNVFRTKESFVGIRPCGLEAPVAFLEGDAGLVSEEVRERVFLEWGARLEAEILSGFPCFLAEPS